MVELNPKYLEDVPLTSYSDNAITAIKTGTWKYVQPVYEDKLPACSHVCPAGNDISKAMDLIARGDVAAAARLWRAGNPLASTLGRVCPHPCESECNRRQFGGAIAIHMLERFLGDSSLDESFLPEKARPTGKKVAVVGAGPAGISAAYSLALAGHEVEVFDDKAKPGGYLRTGIPDYRLPKEILDRELALVGSLGVRFTCSTHVGKDITLDDLKQRFDAVIVAVGFHRSRPLAVPGEDHPNVYNGVMLLERILAGERPELPSPVAVVGGGNTAIDVARSLLRLGVEPIIVYRRSRLEMPAIPGEVDEAEKEGVPFHFLTAPSQVVVEDGRITALECLKMRLGEPDESGRRRPLPVEGSEFRLPVAGVVTAIGESADLELLPESARDGWRVAADERFATPVDGVFAAGDAAFGDGTVTAAVGGGRRVAAVVDRRLGGRELPAAAPSLQKLWQRPVEAAHPVYVEQLNVAYFTESPRPQIEEMDAQARRSSFDEVVQGFTDEQAVHEARRCLVCGTCNECCNCLFFCPDVAIHKRNGVVGFEIDTEHCKGCGICVEECPRSALTLVEVES
ncbi:MAG: FAD-dependent oxidoreductase [Acidobacteria bacterium]|nr:FAD-dependent oxidoreductase [Acidobacteriota bacterium]